MLTAEALAEDSMFDSLPHLVETAGFWKSLVLVVVILGFLLLNKFGSELIKSVKSKQDENLSATKDANDNLLALKEDLKTNHGSKNPGEAIDRLTVLMWQLQKASSDQQTDISSLRISLSETYALAQETRTMIYDLHNKFAEGAE